MTTPSDPGPGITVTIRPAESDDGAEWFEVVTTWDGCQMVLRTLRGDFLNLRFGPFGPGGSAVVGVSEMHVQPTYKQGW